MLYGLQIKIHAHWVDTCGVDHDLDSELPATTIYVYRFLDVADDNHTDGILDMAKTAPGVTRMRPVSIQEGDGAPLPTFVPTDSTDFNYNAATNTFEFSPISDVNTTLSTTMNIIDGSGRSVGNGLTIRGYSEVQDWTVNTASFDSVLAQIAAKSVPWLAQAAYPAGLIDTDAERLSLIQEAITQTELYLSIYQGIEYTPSPYGDADVLTGYVKGAFTQADPALAKTTSGVDSVGFASLVQHRTNYNIAEQNFLLSEVLNQDNNGTIDFYVDRDFANALGTGGLQNGLTLAAIAPVLPRRSGGLTGWVHRRRFSERRALDGTEVAI